MLRERMVLDVAKLTRAAVKVVGTERRPVAVVFRHGQNDVSLGRNTLGDSSDVAAGRAKSAKSLNGGKQGRALVCHNTRNCRCFVKLHLHPCHWLPTSRTRDVRA